MKGSSRRRRVCDEPVPIIAPASAQPQQQVLNHSSTCLPYGAGCCPTTPSTHARGPCNSARTCCWPCHAAWPEGACASSAGLEAVAVEGVTAVVALLVGAPVAEGAALAPGGDMSCSAASGATGGLGPEILQVHSITHHQTKPGRVKQRKRVPE